MKKGSLQEILFSANGRIRRKDYAIGTLIVLAIIVVTSSLSEMLGANTKDGSENIASTLILMAGLLPSMYISICLSIKRFHDIGKSGWFVLTTLIPIIGVIVALILYFKVGNAGANAYGEDPLA